MAGTTFAKGFTLHIKCNVLHKYNTILCSHANLLSVWNQVKDDEDELNYIFSFSLLLLDTLKERKLVSPRLCTVCYSKIRKIYHLGKTPPFLKAKINVFWSIIEVLMEFALFFIFRTLCITERYTFSFYIKNIRFQPR